MRKKGLNMAKWQLWEKGADGVTSQKFLAQQRLAKSSTNLWVSSSC